MCCEKKSEFFITYKLETHVIDLILVTKIEQLSDDLKNIVIVFIENAVSVL